LQVRWFDHWLKNSDSGVLAMPSVRLFEIGRNAWRGFSRWPAGRTALYLAGDGRASVDECSGRLLDAAPADAGVDCLVHDPWRPAPSVGGAFGNPPGPADRSAIDARGDVVTFTTPPFAQELRLAGESAVELWLHCDRPSFDLCSTLSRITRSGQVLTLTQGYRHVAARTALDRALGVPMRATCAAIAPGEALRLSIAAACFPAYPVNPAPGAIQPMRRWTRRRSPRSASATAASVRHS
jgi:putative CocE/NonD family hydrolase